jgi:putative acetyltransferase
LNISVPNHTLHYHEVEYVNFLIDLLEKEAVKMGYRKMYLETHTNLQTAIHVYEKAGYLEIPRPEFVMHNTMNKFYIKEL